MLFNNGQNIMLYFLSININAHKKHTHHNDQQNKKCKNFNLKK